MRWPMALPSYVTRNFYYLGSQYVDGRHGASDIVPVARPAYGEKLFGVEAGQVVFSGWDPSGQRGWMLTLLVNWSPGVVFRITYAHLRERSWLRAGDIVAKHQLIGYADSTGNVTGPHLHIDVWCNVKLSAEAYWSPAAGAWKHNPEVWLSKAEVNEEVDDMAQVPQAEWNDLRGKVDHLYHVSSDNQVPNVPRWAWTVGTINRIRELADMNRAILFDDLSNDAASDKRRLIGIGQAVKAILDQPGLTPAELTALTAVMNNQAAGTAIKSGLQKLLA